MDSGSKTRSATHSGSWYTGDWDELRGELNGYLEMAEKALPKDSYLKAIIAPHAGYTAETKLFLFDWTVYVFRTNSSLGLH